MDTLTTRYLLLACLLLTAAGLRFHRLGRQSYWGDEIATLEQSRRPTLSALVSEINVSGRKQLPYYMVTHLIGRGLGFDLIWFRALSALAGTVAVVLLYQLGKLTGGRAVGLVAAAILAISPRAIYYSQEARVYALLMAMLLAGACCLWKYVNDPGPHPKKAWLLGYVAASLACLALHSFSLLAILSQGIFMATLPKLRRFSVFVLAILLSTVPVIFGLVLYRWMQIPTFVDALEFFIWAFSGILVFLPFVFANSLTSSGPEKRFLFLWASLPVFAAWLISWLVKPVWSDRYFLMCVPPLYLLASFGLNRWVPPRFVPLLVVVILVAGTANLDLRLEYYRTDTKPQYQQALHYLSQTPEVALVVEKTPKWIGAVRYGLMWYLKNTPASFPRSIDELSVGTQTMARLKQIRRLWWITPPNYELPKEAGAIHVIRTEHFNAFDAHFVAVNP